MRTDLQLYDLALCFDSMWWEETCNDIWDKNIKDDRFALIAQLNKESVVAVKTPVGHTDRFVLKQVEMQGTVLSPLKCSAQLDTAGLEAYEKEEDETFFRYKGLIRIPPIEMIDV